MKRHATADDYFAAAEAWREELLELRELLRSTELEETVKWGGPVDTLDGKNVVGLGGFKSYFGLWFFQGALLADSAKVLVNAQAGKTKALRQLRFRSADELDRELVAGYVQEAIELARQGVEIQPERGRPVEVPAELEAALAENPAAGRSFEALTLGRRREYADYVASAKRDDTRRRRVEKIVPMIVAGVGLNDRYRGRGPESTIAGAGSADAALGASLSSPFCAARPRSGQA